MSDYDSERLGHIDWPRTKSSPGDELSESEFDQILNLAVETNLRGNASTLHPCDFDKVCMVVAGGLVWRYNDRVPAQHRDVLRLYAGVLVAERQNRFVKGLEEESRKLQEAAVKMTELSLQLQNENNEIATRSERVTASSEKVARQVKRLTVWAILLAAVAVLSKLWIWWISR